MTSPIASARPPSARSQQNLAFYTTRAKSRTSDGEDGEEFHGGAELKKARERQTDIEHDGEGGRKDD